MESSSSLVIVGGRPATKSLASSGISRVDRGATAPGVAAPTSGVPPMLGPIAGADALGAPEDDISVINKVSSAHRQRDIGYSVPVRTPYTGVEAAQWTHGAFSAPPLAQAVAVALLHQHIPLGL